MARMAEGFEHAAVKKSFPIQAYEKAALLSGGFFKRKSWSGLLSVG